MSKLTFPTPCQHTEPCSTYSVDWKITVRLLVIAKISLGSAMGNEA